MTEDTLEFDQSHTLLQSHVETDESPKKEILKNCIFRGQFLYPERGQKQAFFDPLPPRLVYVVIEWPLTIY